VKLLIFATELEALPFIKNMKMKVMEETKVKTFSNGSTDLIITGIGKSNAAMSTALALSAKDYDGVLNLGAAGALKAGISRGDIFSVKKITEPDRPKIKTGGLRITFPEKEDTYRGKTLATRDRAAIDKDDRDSLSKIADIVDMEGAAILQACKKFGKNCKMIKFISDSIADNGKTDIAENIIILREVFYKDISDKGIV